MFKKQNKTKLAGILTLHFDKLYNGRSSCQFKDKSTERNYISSIDGIIRTQIQNLIVLLD